MSEVASAIRLKLQRQQAAELASKQGAELLGRLQKGEKAEVNWQAAKSISRAQHAGVELELAKLVFKLEATKLPAYVGVQTAQSEYVLARVDSVKDVAEIDEGKRNRYLQQISQITGEELLSAYLRGAKKEASITIKPFVSEDKK
jgi:peptidyl-prolyl cis-trans isomerase D